MMKTRKLEKSLLEGDIQLMERAKDFLHHFCKTANILTDPEEQAHGDGSSAVDNDAKELLTHLETQVFGYITGLTRCQESLRTLLQQKYQTE